MTTGNERYYMPTIIMSVNSLAGCTDAGDGAVTSLVTPKGVFETRSQALGMPVWVSKGQV